MTVDIEITKLRPDGTVGKFFDINIVDGDLQNERNFDSALKVSLFAERRANKSEVVSPQYRRGWWGNETGKILGFEIGSKLWLLLQNRLTDGILNKAIDYAKTSLEWLIEDGHADDVEVSGVIVENGIQLEVRIIRDGSPVDARYFDLWENTGSIS